MISLDSRFLFPPEMAEKAVPIAIAQHGVQHPPVLFYHALKSVHFLHHAG